jgi:hypothetical protein
MTVRTVIVIALGPNNEIQARYTWDDATNRVTALDAENPSAYPVWVEFVYQPTGDHETVTVGPGETYHHPVNLPVTVVDVGISELSWSIRYPA